MAAKFPSDDQSGTITFDAPDKSLFFEGLNEFQLNQVRKIVREEIKAALLALWESNNIGNIPNALMKRLDSTEAEHE